MSLNTQQIVNDIYSYTGVDEADYDRNIVLLEANKSFWELMPKLSFRENELSGSFPLIADVPRYTFPVLFEAIRSLSVIDPLTSQSSVIVQTNSHYYDTILNINNAQASGKPTFYWRENDELVVWRTPDKAYDCTLRYYVTLDDLVDSSANFPPIPQEWHEIIMLGGVWRMFARMGDKKRSDDWHNTQIGLINSTVPVESLEKSDTQLARARVLRPRYNPYITAQTQTNSLEIKTGNP